MLFSCRFLRYFKQMGNTTWKNYNAWSTDSNTVCRKLRHFTSTDDGFRHVFLNFHAFNVSYFFSNVSSLHLWLQHTHSDSECWRDGRERLQSAADRALSAVLHDCPLITRHCSSGTGVSRTTGRWSQYNHALLETDQGTVERVHEWVSE